MIDYTPIFNAFLKRKMHGLYDVVYPGLLRNAAGVLGDELSYLAEDCVQDAIMATYANRSRLEDVAHWRSYLILSVRNRALKVLRHQDVKSSYEADAGDAEYVKDVSNELIWQETLDTLYATIDSLPGIYRDVFDLSFEQGLKTAEIADMLDIAEITVKKRKQKMISILREKLGNITTDELILILSTGGFLNNPG